MINALLLGLANLVLKVGVVSAGMFSSVQYQPTLPASLKK